MKQYIGTKVVLAIAMTYAQFKETTGLTLPTSSAGVDDGYLVEYTDGGKSNHPDHKGYISWSPKDVFENAYRPTDRLSFGLAIEALKQGKRVARSGWNGKGMWLALGGTPVTLEADKFWNPHSKAHAIANGGSAVVEPYIIMKTVRESIQMGWNPTQSDVLADDWLIV